MSQSDQSAVPCEEEEAKLFIRFPCCEKSRTCSTSDWLRLYSHSVGCQVFPDTPLSANFPPEYH